MENMLGLIENYLRDMSDGEHRLILHISKEVYDTLLNSYTPEGLNNLFDIEIKPIDPDTEARFMFITTEPLVFEEEELKLLVN